MPHTFGTTLLARTSSASNPITRSVTTTRGETVLVLFLTVGGSADRTGGSPTLDGVAGVQADIAEKAAASPEAGAEVWYWERPLLGTANIVIPNAGALTIFSSAYTGKAADGFTSKFDASGGANGTSTNPATSAVVTTVNGAIIFALTAGGWQAFAPSARTGTSLFETDDGATGAGGQYLEQPTAGSQAMSWTFGTSDDWGAVGVAFKEVPEDRFDRNRIKSGPFPFPKEAKDRFLTAVNPDVTVALSGVAATAALGVLTAALTLGLVGETATAAAGTVTPTLALAVSTVLGTSGLGSVTPAFSLAASGVAGTGAAGSVAPAADVPLTTVLGTGELGALGAEGGFYKDRPRVVTGPFPFPKEGRRFVAVTDTTAALIGESGTGSVGSVAVDVTLALSGVAGTGSVWSLTAAIDTALTGEQGTGQLGSLSVEGASNWERPRIVTGPFPFPKAARQTVQSLADANAALTGVSGTGSVGSLSVDVTVALTGVSATGQLGSVVAVGDVIDRPRFVHGPFPFLIGGQFQFRTAPQPVLPAVITLTGVAGTGAVGTATPTVTVALTGVSATGSVGTVTATQGNVAALTSVSGTGSVGTTTPSLTVALTGVSGTGALGSLTVVTLVATPDLIVTAQSFVTTVTVKGFVATVIVPQIQTGTEP